MKIPEKKSKLPVVWELRKIVLYTFYSVRGIFKLKKIDLIWESFFYFPIWWKYKRRNLDPLDCDRPWITFKAKNHLDSLLNSDMTVFEYGSGSSTLYFSRRVAKIVSLENDKRWYAHLDVYLRSLKIRNVENHLIEEIDDEISSIYKSSGKSFEKYVKFIDSFPDDSFDIVVVDGRARRACIKHALPKLRKSGYLIVDNSERKGYFEGNEILFDPLAWKSISIAGPVPYVFEFSQTSFFQKI
jgi:hypothetical protein